MKYVTEGKKKGKASPVRFAVVGMGHIAQAAVLPAFRNAGGAKLAAIVSDDAVKRKKLGRQYGVPAYSYEDYERCLQDESIEAVYIALPNSLHREYVVRAGAAGVHVLCEKPMAVTEDHCREMIAACEEGGVRLMIAYRLHFEEANLKAVEIARSGKLGKIRAFNSVFTMQVKPGDIRLQSELGGGTLYDIGIYCINAARYIFRSEPESVFAASVSSGDMRFREVDEMTSATLRFSEDRLATFTCSFGANPISYYEIVGTKGSLRVEPAYEYSEGLAHEMTIGEKKTRTPFGKRDQFAAELIYFSGCVRTGRYPEPSGTEGLADVRVIRALYESARENRPVELGEFSRALRPSLQQEIKRSPSRKPAELVHTASPSGD